MTTADGIAGLLPSLSDALTLSAVDTVALAASLRGLATEYAWEGTPPQDIDAVCELRRKLHALTSVIDQRGPYVPPDAVVDLDTATRLIERAAIGVIIRAQQDGTVAKGDGPRARLLGTVAGRLYRLHTEIDWAAFGDALDRCRAAGSVKLTDVEQAITGGDPEVFADEPAPVLPRSLDEVRRTVRGIITDVRGAASAAEALTVADVDTLEPAESADLARELWDQMVITTRAYAALHGRGRQRRSA